MANEKLCFKDYLSCPDNNMLSKTRKKMNAKSHKKRVYGLDWGVGGAVNISGDGGVAVGESMGDGMGMHDGALPSGFSANVLSNTQAATNSDMKKQNRRNAPSSGAAMGLNKWLQFRQSAEDEEDSDEVYDKIDRMLRSGITDPEEIADQVGVPVDDVISYIDDIESENVDNSDEIESSDDVGGSDEYSSDEYSDDFDFSKFDFTGGIADDEYDDPEDEGSDFAELDFNTDVHSEHDLDNEFVDPDELESDPEYDPEDEFRPREEEEEDRNFGYQDDEFVDDESDPEYDVGEELTPPEDEFDDFGDIANQMVDKISDEVIDDIDASTGIITRWWREQIVQSSGEPAGDEYAGNEYEEEQETARPAGPPKIDRARMVFQRMMNQPGMTRGDIIAAFVTDVDVTHSTAVSYYERLAKEAGLTKQDEIPGGGMGGGGGGMGRGPMAPAQQPQAPVQELPADTDLDLEGEVDPSGDPDRQGIIRVVDNAHLVYKRQSEEGTFEELWTYNIGSSVKDELKIRRSILAGTDIPQNRTQSEDGSQTYKLTTMGNAQLLHITGLPN